MFRRRQPPHFLRPTASALLLTMLLATPATAQNAYRWVDKQGRTVYGSKPPANAQGVEKLKTKALSRYSSSKVLERLGWEERKAAIEQKQREQAKTTALPLDAQPAELHKGEPRLDLGQAGEILGCVVEIRNSGDLLAAEVSVAFEFPDGTLVPAVGPDTIIAGSSAEYSIPDELVPFFVKLEGEDRPAPEALLPNVVVHGATN